MQRPCKTKIPQQRQEKSEVQSVQTLMCTKELRYMKRKMRIPTRYWNYWKVFGFKIGFQDPEKVMTLAKICI